LTHAQHVELVKSGADYLKDEHGVTISASLLSTMPSELREFWNQLRNKGNGAAWYWLPPTLSVDMNHIENVLPAKYSQKYIKHPSKSNVLDTSLYNFVLGKRTKRQQATTQVQKDGAPPKDPPPPPPVLDADILNALMQAKSSAAAANEAVKVAGGDPPQVPLGPTGDADRNVTPVPKPSEGGHGAAESTVQEGVESTTIEGIEIQSQAIPTTGPPRTDPPRTDPPSPLRMAPGQRTLRENGGTAASKADAIHNKDQVGIALGTHRVGQSEPSFSR
jgi:hypothetical protein